MYYYTFSVDERVFLLLVYFLQAGVVHLWRGGTSHPESVLSAVLLLSHALKFIFLITWSINGAQLWEQAHRCSVSTSTWPPAHLGRHGAPLKDAPAWNPASTPGGVGMLHRLAATRRVDVGQVLGGTTLISSYANPPLKQSDSINQMTV